MRELKIGDRVVDWKDRAGVVIATLGESEFYMRYEDGTTRCWDWFEFTPEFDDGAGTFRFEDTEYPEWPR